MQRRKFLIGMGSLAAGSAAVMGTGAFGDVDAERNMSGGIVDDGSAYLSLTSPSKYSEVASDGEIEITLDRLNDEAENSFDSVLNVTNNGTDQVYVWIDVTANGDSGNIYFYPDGDENSKISTNAFTANNGDVGGSPGNEGAFALPVGNQLTVGLFFDTRPSSGGAFAADPAFTIHADDTSANSTIGTL
ncbi:hypothetical protein [Haloarcula litorea]|uniref:hypothetical protein n=1 Tax=Haloarcula litorea TaxID=3032579 RepID=UPI0023E7D8AD|nr:hypothetical protein [Halomicroarcula sp. GDY20]